MDLFWPARRTDARFALDDAFPLELVTLTGATVTMMVAALDTDPDRVSLLGEIAIDAWDEVTTSGAFHTDLDSGALPGEPSNVEVTLILREPLAAMYPEGETVLAALFDAEPTPIRHTEAWLLASATRSIEVPGGEGATSSSGFRTQWAPPII